METKYIFEPNHIFKLNQPFTHQSQTTSTFSTENDDLEISTQTTTLILFYELIAYLIAELSYLHKINNNIASNKQILTNYYYEYNPKLFFKLIKNSPIASKHMSNITNIIQDLTNTSSLNRFILLQAIFELEDDIYIHNETNNTYSKVNTKESFNQWQNLFNGPLNFNLDENANKTITITNQQTPTKDINIAHSNLYFIYWLLHTGIYDYYICDDENKFQILQTITSRTKLTGGLFIQYQLFLNNYLQNYLLDENCFEINSNTESENNSSSEDDLCNCKCHTHNYNNRFCVEKQIVCYCCDDTDCEMTFTDEEEETGASSDELSSGDESNSDSDCNSNSDEENENNLENNFRLNPDAFHKGAMLNQFKNEIINLLTKIF